jgi:hypothetical protein
MTGGELLLDILWSQDQSLLFTARGKKKKMKN